MDWKNVWKLPLVKLDFDDSYAWTADEKGNLTMALTLGWDVEEADTFELSHLVDVINGNIETDYTNGWTADGCDVFYNNEYIFCVRGWGELVSPGGHNLSYEEAAETQDAFVNYIIGKLNGIS